MLGAILEGETVAFLGGVLAHKHVYAFESAALAISLGAAIVDNALFLIGRGARDNAYVQKNLTRPAAQRFVRLLDRNNLLAILGFRFIYGMKTVGALTMGTTSIGWTRFFVTDLVAVLLWSHVIVGLGYLAGSAVTALFGDLRLHWHLAVSLGVFFAAGAALFWARRSRR